MTYILIILSIINFLIFYNLKKFSKIIGIFDVPDKKLKLHERKIPILGGPILFINLIIFLSYQIFFLNDLLSIKLNQLNLIEIFSTLIMILSCFFLGIYDDKFRLNPNKKVIILITIILLSIFLNKNLIITNFSLTFFENRIFFENFSIIFTIFCILILINSLNFYDGINGQSCIIFFVFFSYLFLKSDLNLFYLISIILILMVMIFNFKNVLFLGDSGIYLLSIILSISLIFEHNIQKNISYADEIFFLLLLPGFDLVRLTITRIFNKKNPFLGDRKHIHHLLIRRFSLFSSNVILFFLSILPITIFLFVKLNFFWIFSIFSIIYIFLIQFLKSNDKNKR